MSEDWRSQRDQKEGKISKDGPDTSICDGRRTFFDESPIEMVDIDDEMLRHKRGMKAEAS